MKLLAKILLGILSFGPIAFFAAFFLWLIPAFFRRSSGESSLFATRFQYLLAVAMATSVLLLVLLGIYALMLWRRRDITVAEKVGIPLAIVFSNGLVLPFVWWVYVWRESTLSALLERRG